MPTVRVDAHLSSEDLLRAVQQMDLQELEHFVSEVIALRARRQAPLLTQSEADLLRKINEGPPADLRQRYQALISLRDEERLTPEEHTELLCLTDQMERLQAQRVEHLVALAQLRKKSLGEVMDDLGLGALGDGGAAAVP